MMIMQLLVKKHECPYHPDVVYDPRVQECPHCEQEKIDDVIRALDGTDDEMVFE
jgi:hypothetical protein